MGYMKEIYIETLNETKDLSIKELRKLLRKKNKKLNITELIEMYDRDQLIASISEKNLLLTAKKLK